jgi:hypothetical protein
VLSPLNSPILELCQEAESAPRLFSHDLQQEPVDTHIFAAHDPMVDTARREGSRLSDLERATGSGALKRRAARDSLVLALFGAARGEPRAVVDSSDDVTCLLGLDGLAVECVALAAGGVRICAVGDQ